VQAARGHHIVRALLCCHGVRYAEERQPR